MIMASPQNTLKLTQTNPYTTQNQNLDRVFRGAPSSMLFFGVTIQAPIREGPQKTHRFCAEGIRSRHGKNAMGLDSNNKNPVGVGQAKKRLRKHKSAFR
jgi:hypothetical protein